MAELLVVVHLHPDFDVARAQLQALRRHAPPRAEFWFLPFPGLSILDRLITGWAEADILPNSSLESLPRLLQEEAFKGLISVGSDVLVASGWSGRILREISTEKPQWLKWWRENGLHVFNRPLLQQYPFPSDRVFPEALVSYQKCLLTENIFPISFIDEGSLLPASLKAHQYECDSCRSELKTFANEIPENFFYSIESVQWLNLAHRGYVCQLRGWFFYRKGPVVIEPEQPSTEWQGHLPRQDVRDHFPWEHAFQSGWQLCHPFPQGKRETTLSLLIKDLQGTLLARWTIIVQLPRAKIGRLIRWLQGIHREHLREGWRLLLQGEVGRLWRAVQLATAASSPTVEQETIPLLNLSALKEALRKRHPLPSHGPVDIVVPIYNQADLVRRLLRSLRENTTPPYRLILIDDASTDPAISEILEELTKDPVLGGHVTVLRNQTNLGFAATVNRGLKEAQHDVVILNSDTEVPPGWLERLLLPLQQDDQVASVTPMTNCGTIASFPRFCADNPLPPGTGVADLDRLFRPLAHAEPVEAPTGVGFCMALARHALNEVGLFDEATFGRGYGEENDWCQRAVRKGYKNVIYPGLLIWHKHGGSFPSEEKRRLMAANLKKLRQRYPSYETDVQTFIRRDPLRVYRMWAAAEWKRQRTGTSPLILLDHDEGGGANTYSKQLIEEASKKRAVFRVTYRRKMQSFFLEGFFEHGKEEGRLEGSQAVLDLIDTFEQPEVFYNSFYTYPTQEVESLLRGLKPRLEGKQIHLVLAVHDFMPLCPSYNLMGWQGRFCGLPTEIEKCHRCLPLNRWNAFPGITIDRWRQLWQPLVKGADEVICFSRSSAELVQRIYDVPEERLAIRPHRVVLPETFREPIQIDPKASLHIAVVGGINMPKGAQVVAALVRELEKRGEGHLTVVGKLSDVSIESERLTVTGGYRLEDLPKMLEKLGVNVALVPSVCPETFNLVVSELMALGLPIACFDVGAPPERVRDYPKGIVLPLSLAEDPDQLLAHLQFLKDKVL